MHRMGCFWFNIRKRKQNVRNGCYEYLSLQHGPRCNKITHFMTKTTAQENWNTNIGVAIAIKCTGFWNLKTWNKTTQTESTIHIVAPKYERTLFAGPLVHLLHQLLWQVHFLRTVQLCAQGPHSSCSAALTAACPRLLFATCCVILLACHIPF